MDIIQFIFKLLLKYVPIDSADYARIKGQAVEWYASIRTDAEADNSTHPFAKKIKEFGSKWYVQLFLAVLFIFASRWIFDYLNPSKEAAEADDLD